MISPLLVALGLLVPAVQPQDVFAVNKALGRGINLGNALEAPKEGEWGVKLKAEYFTAIKKAGFATVRLPVRWSAHAGKEAPYTIDPKFAERVDWALWRQTRQPAERGTARFRTTDEISKGGECSRRIAAQRRDSFNENFSEVVTRMSSASDMNAFFISSTKFRQSARTRVPGDWESPPKWAARTRSRLAARSRMRRRSRARVA